MGPLRTLRRGPADLDATIMAWQAAAEVAAEADTRVYIFNNLGRALHARFMRNGTGSDLDALITAFRAATEYSPASYPFRAMILANLGAALGERFARAGEPADLDTAIDVLGASVAGTPPGHPDLPDRLAALGERPRAGSSAHGRQPTSILRSGSWRWP